MLVALNVSHYMNHFDDLKNQRLREQDEQVRSAALAAAARDEKRRQAQALAERFSLIVVPVLEEFLEAMNWKGHRPKVEINVHALYPKPIGSPETGRGGGVPSEVVWIVPNPESGRPDHPSYALVTVCLAPGDRHFTCYLPHRRFGLDRHPKWGLGTPTAEAKLTAESLAATLTKLYMSR